MIRQDQFAFPQAAPEFGITIYDNMPTGALNQAALSLLTPGATVLASPAVAAQINQMRSLLAVGVTGGLSFSEVTQPSIYGRLGRIIAGILPATDTQPGGSTGAYLNPQLLPLPNPNLSFPLWDPNVDPLPPTSDTSFPAVGDTLPVSGSLQLPNPLDLTAGEQITIGLWMLPSLIGSNYLNAGAAGYGLDLYNATYMLTYDDGT